MKAESTCKHCGKELPKKKSGRGSPKQYCDAICRRTYAYRKEKANDQPNGRFCYVCGKELTGRRKKQCDECLQAAGERKQQWREGRKRPVTKVCEQCGKSYQPHKLTKERQRFCSEECNNVWRNKNRKGERLHPFTCLNCGKDSLAARKKYTRFCSRECAFDFRSKRIALAHAEKKESALAALEKDCIQCGKKFTAKRLSQKLCSEECRLERNRQRFREHRRAIGKNAGRVEVHPCQHCGKEFKQTVYNQVKVYCSKKCARAAWKIANPDKARAMVVKQRHTRRMRKQTNSPADNIDPIKVFERDGWKCGICGKKVSPYLKHPHPRSASLDHIIALANGGTHTWQNVQCAHLICNSKKQDVGGGQLRLGITHETN